MGSRSPCGIAAVLPRRAPGQLGLSAFLPSREPRGAGDPASRSLWRADPATRGPSERPDRVFLLVLPFPPAARWPRRRERRGSWQRSRPPDSGSSFIFAGGRGEEFGREGMREELRQIIQTLVKDKLGNDLKDSHPSLSAERGSSRWSPRPGGRPLPAPGLGGFPAGSVDYRPVNAPTCLCLFSFFLSVHRVISDCK